MTLYGHKTAFVALMLSFGLFIWSWKCFMLKPHAHILSKDVLLVGNFAMKSNFGNIGLSVFVGFVLPLAIIISTKILLMKKYSKIRNKKNINS